MDQQMNSELPPIQAERPVPQSTEVPYGATHIEANAGAAIESGQAAPPQAAQQAYVAQQAVAASSAAGTASVPAMPAAAMPTIADDNDLIEKEWVMKAKAIVERTRHDPYQQNKEVEKMKADYLKKRYNKDIKITED